LVSEEGAAYIVGRELGINLLKESKRRLKIKNLVSGLRSVDITARIINVSEPWEFEKKGKKGRVVNVLMGDDTGAVRLSLWNDEINMIDKGELKEDSTIRITGGYVKEDNRGSPEVRLGRGKMEQVEEDIEVANIQQFKQEDFSVSKTAKRKTIKDFGVGEYAETRACLDYQMVISGVIDDGSDNIRAVFFRELAERVLGKNVKELRELADKENDVLGVYDHITGLGKDYIMKRTLKNCLVSGKRLLRSLKRLVMRI
jgi:ssDNA-binding replication factor A large subunit